MNRIVMLIFTLIISLGLASCKDSQGADNVRFNFLHNLKTDITVSLGMTQEEVEALLGQGDYLNWQSVNDEKMERVGVFGEGEDTIEITFENDRVTKLCTISLYKDYTPAPSNWSTQYGLTYGNTIDNIISQYGEAEVENFEDYFSYIFYYYNASGEQVHAVADASYCVVFYLDAAGEEIQYCYVASSSTLQALPLNNQALTLRALMCTAFLSYCRSLSHPRNAAGQLQRPAFVQYGGCSNIWRGQLLELLIN